MVAYNEAVALAADNSDPKFSIFYSELVVGFSRVKGGCLEWAKFLSSWKESMSGPKVVSKITMFETSELGSSVKERSTECVRYSRNISNGLWAFGRNSVSCNGQVWHTEKCGELPADISLCVNCAETCPSSGDENSHCSRPSFFLSPCSTVCPVSSGDNGRIIILRVDMEFFSSPPSILKFTAKPTTSSLSLSLTFSSAGYVNCAALKAPFRVNSISTISMHSSMTPISWNKDEFAHGAYITIAALSPATSYDVYCMTQSIDGAEMNLSTVIATGRKTVETLCCKRVSVDLLVSSIVLNSELKSIATITLDSAPTTELIIFLSCLYRQTNTSSAAVSTFPFVSSAIEVLASSLVRTYSIEISNADFGIYELAFSLAGISSSEFDVFYTQGKVITLSPSYIEPLSPSLKSAVFSDNGALISVRFTASTDRAYLGNGLFVCSEIISFYRANSTNCQWASDSLLEVHLGTKSSVVVGNELSLYPLKLRSKCDRYQCTDWKTAAGGVVVIQAPLTPRVPVVSISAPSTIGGCDDLTLDFTGSTGSGGRNWNRSGVEVLTSDPNNTYLTAFLNAHQDHFNAPLKIPRCCFHAGYSYTFIVTLCNFLNSCSSSNHRVSVISSQALPVVTLQGSQQISVQQNRMELIVSGYFRECDGSQSNSNLQYSWEMFNTRGLIVDNKFRSLSVDPRKFRLSPGVLTVNTYYYAKVTVLHPTALQTSSLTATIFVSPAAIVPIISGGNERSIGLGETIILDGSSSYDEDTGSNFGLTFSWSNVQLYPIYNRKCPLSLYLLTDRQLEVMASEENVNVTCAVTMTVSDSTRHKSQRVVVSVIPHDLAHVEVSSTVLRINSYQRVKMSGKVSMVSSGQIYWTLTDPIVQLESIALTSTKWTVSAAGLSAQSFDLVVRPGLITNRAGFTFRLNCVLSTGQSSSAALTFAVNSAPVGGVIAVDPVSGKSMTTMFSLLTSKWNDDDLPLSFELGYVDTSTKMEVVLQEMSSKNLISTLLPPGRDVPEDSMLVILARAIDVFLAGSTVSSVVVVENVQMSARNLSAIIDYSLASGGSLDTRTLFTIVTSAMNSVDCTSILVNCSALNREACGKVANTCGECVSGYIGVLGPDNSKCFIFEDSLNLNSRRLLSQDTFCRLDADCVSYDSHMSLVCSNGRCRVPMKNCFQNCSNRGQCIFRDSRSYVPLPECLQSDLYCEAFCECDSFYSGKACDISSVEFVERQSVREKMLNGLKNLTFYEDNLARNIAAWINLLSSMSLQSGELSVEAIVLMLGICEHILRSTKDVPLEYEALMNLLDPLNTISVVVDNWDSISRAAFDARYSGTDSKILLQMLAESIGEDVAIGQRVPSYVNSNLRIQVIKPDLLETQNVRIGVPLTMNEMAVGVVPSFCELNLTSTSTFLIASRNSGSYNQSGFASNPLEISARSLMCTSEPCQIIFDLQNNHEIDYNSTANSSSATFFTTYCKASETMVFNHSCESGQLIYHNCTGSAEILTTECKPAVLIPTCRFLINDEPIMDKSLCRVLWYNSTRTRCQCTLKNFTKSLRRLSVDVDSGVAERETATVVIMTDHVVVTFVDTLRTADTTSLSTFRKAATVVVFIAVITSILVFNIVNPIMLVLRLFGAVKSRNAIRPPDGGGRLHGTPKCSAVLPISRFGNLKSQSTNHFLATYVESVIPAVFRMKSNAKALLYELHRHHRYLAMFSKSTKLRHRAKLMLHVYTSMLFMFFMLVLVFDLEVN